MRAVRLAGRVSGNDVAVMIAAGIEAAINGGTPVRPICGDPYHRHTGPCEMYARSSEEYPVPHTDLKIRITESMIDAVRRVTIARGSEQIREIIAAAFQAAGFEVIE